MTGSGQSRFQRNPGLSSYFLHHMNTISGKCKRSDQDKEERRIALLSKLPSEVLISSLRLPAQCACRPLSLSYPTCSQCSNSNNRAGQGLPISLRLVLSWVIQLPSPDRLTSTPTITNRRSTMAICPKHPIPMAAIRQQMAM